MASIVQMAFEALVVEFNLKHIVGVHDISEILKLLFDSIVRFNQDCHQSLKRVKLNVHLGPNGFW